MFWSRNKKAINTLWLKKSALSVLQKSVPYSLCKQQDPDQSVQMHSLIIVFAVCFGP